MTRADLAEKVAKAMADGLIHVRLNHRIGACLDLESALRDRFGDERRSPIVKRESAQAMSVEETIPSEPVTVESASASTGRPWLSGCDLVTSAPFASLCLELAPFHCGPGNCWPWPLPCIDRGSGWASRATSLRWWGFW